MGLFSRKKKQQEAKKATQKGTPVNQTDAKNTERNDDEEFNRDIKELMARDDIHNRTEICEAEFEKALSLIEGEPDEESVHRCYDIMGNLASQFEYVPAIMWMGDFLEGAVGDMEQAAYWFRMAAELGDGEGARCYADMLMAGNGVQQDTNEAFKYYSLASDRGVAEASFIMGELMRASGQGKEARKYYMKAVDAGYAPAKIRLQQLNY